MFERLEQIEARYDELTNALASPEIVNDSARYQKTAKAHSEIVPVVEKYREYKDLTRGIAESKALLANEPDADMRAYAAEARPSPPTSPLPEFELDRRAPGDRDIRSRSTSAASIGHPSRATSGG